MKQQNPNTYEAEEGFTLEFLEPQHAIDVNRKTIVDDFSQTMPEREALVLELLIRRDILEVNDIMTGYSVMDNAIRQPVIHIMHLNHYAFSRTSQRSAKS